MVDTPEPRKIRGRKRYWPTFEEFPTAQGNNASVTSKRWVAPVKSTVTGKIYFEGLTKVELGALLASIDPNLLLSAGLQVPKADVLPPVDDSDNRSEGDPQPLVHMIGGGKPYGLGAVNPSITCLEVWNSSRYEGSESAPTTSEDGAAAPCEGKDALVANVEEFVKATQWIAQEGDANSLPKHIGQLLAMSQFNRFPAAVVKYPPDQFALAELLGSLPKQTRREGLHDSS